MKTCPQCSLRYPDDSTFCFVDGATLRAEPDGVVGRTFGGRFTAEAVLGESPWATVLRARRRLIQAECALKIFKTPVAESERTAFERVTRLASRCTHPSVVSVVGGGVDAQGMAFVALGPMPPGRPLSTMISRGPIALGQCATIAAQLLRALARIHDVGMAHGDVRPSNIVVRPDGQIAVLDAGVGRTAFRALWEPMPQALAAQHHLAPELRATERRAPGAEDGGAASDLYAVGVTVFEMLTQRLPLEAANVGELRERLGSIDREHVRVATPGVAEPVVDWLSSLLEPSPAARPASARVALTGLCQAAGIPAPPEPDESTVTAGRTTVELEPAFARWQGYRSVLLKLVELGFPAGPPDHVRKLLERLGAQVEALQTIGGQARYYHEALGEAVRRAHEGRSRLASQIAELTDRAATIRSEARPLRLAAERHGQKALEFPSQAREAHQNVLSWEGRFGFSEPHRELAQAYRTMADLVDKWWAVRNAQLTCETEAAETEERIGDVEAELAALRQALRVHESNVEAEVESCEQALATLGNQTDEIHPELVGLATRLVAPLRAKPELGATFRELERL